MKEQITANGLILSEFLPGTPPSPANFPIRNRVLSGLTMGTLVIQAPQRSGTLITAENAMEQGRDVFCVPPANIFDKQYQGVIKYLRDGAIPVFDCRDIVYEYYTNHAHQIDGSVLYDEDRSKSDSMVMTMGEEAQEKEKKAKKPPESPETPQVPAAPSAGEFPHAHRCYCGSGGHGDGTADGNADDSGAERRDYTASRKTIPDYVGKEPVQRSAPVR